jgi:hypothetical protein
MDFLALTKKKEKKKTKKKRKEKKERILKCSHTHKKRMYYF